MLLRPSSFFFFFVDLQDASITYVVTGFVEYKDHHFVAYVKQPRGWVKCDDSVVRVVGHDVGTIWPRLFFCRNFGDSILGTISQNLLPLIYFCRFLSC